MGPTGEIIELWFESWEDVCRCCIVSEPELQEDGSWVYKIKML